MAGEFLKRLQSLLDSLDEKLQSEGLFPDEIQVREWVHGIMELDKVYQQHFDGSIWVELAPHLVDELATQMLRTRERLHSIEGERFVLSALMREVGRLDRIVRQLCEIAGIEWPAGYEHNDADV